MEALAEEGVMFVLITYDVEARRTRLYRKLFGQFLGHEQNSVFFGDLTEASHRKLRSLIQKVAIPDDRILEISAVNRRNVAATVLMKNPNNGTLAESQITKHVDNAAIL